ncbi:MAG TPA: sulfotransferase domain-containing protein [Gemmatimonadales bacterium]
MSWLLAAAGAVALFLFVEWIALGIAMHWGQQQTLAGAWFRRSLEARRRFRATLRRQAMLLSPVLWALRPFARFDFARTAFRVRGVTGPWGNCTPQSFEAALDYRPRPDDVIVATQMKCGTTWMLHLVYQVLLRGRGDLVETGRALHALVPWLEGTRTVPVTDAPLIGTERPSRVIKTHLPAGHCPGSAEAKYIYVARHPVACFASCVDFVIENAWPYPPTLGQLEAWFTSEEQMWWGTWPGHVQGWWDRAASSSNVLFVHFEEMKRDLPAVTRQVATFLGMAPLSAEELGAVVAKCSFGYMQQHAEAFEMHPPHLRAAEAELFRKGSADRHLDVPGEVRRRVGAWAAAAQRGRSYPLAANYPDLAEADAAL